MPNDRGRRAAPGNGRENESLRTARVLRLLVAWSLLGLAAVSLATSLIEYGVLKDHLDAFAVDRDAGLTAGEFDRLVTRLRLLAIVCAGTALGLLVRGHVVDRAAGETLAAWARTVRAAPAGAGRWFSSEDRVYVGAMATIFAIAVAVRLPVLGLPMRYDEAATYNNFVSRPLYVGLSNYAEPNNHLLHTFLASLSTAVFGDGPQAIRLPALLAGLALVPATFALAWALFGRSAAALAAALVAGSSSLVEYSTNARGYTIVAVVTVLLLIAAVRVLDRDSAGAWGALAVLGALGLFAVPIMLYPLVGVLAWLVLSHVVAGRPVAGFARRLGAYGAGLVLFTALLYAPVFVASGVRSVTSNDFVEPSGLVTVLELLPGHLSDTAATWVRDVPAAGRVLLGLGLVASLALTPRLSRFAVPPVLVVALVGLVLVLLQRVVPYTRVWLFLLPLVLATVAGFYGFVFDRRLGGARVAAVVAALVAATSALIVATADSVRQSRETGGLPDAEAVAAILAGRVRPQDRVLAIGSDTILEYYLGRQGIDARPLLYDESCARRTFVVVNEDGGRTLRDDLRDLAGAGDLGSPTLLRRFPSAAVYVVRRRCTALDARRSTTASVANQAQKGTMGVSMRG